MAPLALSSQTSDALHAIIAKATSDPQHQLPRLVVMAASPTSLLYSGAGGVEQLPPAGSSIADSPPATPDSIFELWSCTKLVSCISALQLVEQSKIGLLDAASKYLPELGNVRIFKGMDEEGEPVLEVNTVPITIEMLINHTAGFSYGYDCPEYDQYRAKSGIPLDLRLHTRETFITLPLRHVPGTRWQYGTSNDWLTLVIEAVTGIPVASYFETNIFAPLGITDMTFERPPNKINMAFVPTDPSAAYDVGPETTWTFRGGGAGLHGSPRSYLTILQCLLNGGAIAGGGRLLSTATVDLMFEHHLSNDQQRADLSLSSRVDTDPFTRLMAEPPAVEWGYGGLLQPTPLFSGRGANAMTWSGVAFTYWIIDRQNDLAFMVWTNTLPTNEMHDPRFWTGNSKFWPVFSAVETELYRGIR